MLPGLACAPLPGTCPAPTLCQEPLPHHALQLSASIDACCRGELRAVEDFRTAKKLVSLLDLPQQALKVGGHASLTVLLEPALRPGCMAAWSAAWAAARWRMLVPPVELCNLFFCIPQPLASPPP